MRGAVRVRGVVGTPAHAPASPPDYLPKGATVVKLAVAVLVITAASWAYANRARIREAMWYPGTEWDMTA